MLLFSFQLWVSRQWLAVRRHCVCLASLGCLAGFSSPLLAQELPATECVSYKIDPLDIAQTKTSRAEVSPFAALQGKTIRAIRFEQMTIFDENNPDENKWAYRTLNKLHVKTRTKVVASQLLFKVGDKVNPKYLEETARNLRTRKYLTNAYVLPEQVCGDAVDVVVITQDAWAIEPQFSFSHTSGDSKTGFAISDANLFGSGNSFKVGYSESELRSAVSYELSNPYFLNKQIALRILHQDTSDGRNNVLSIARPFYSVDSPWASGLQVSDLAQIEEIRARGVVINSFLHQAIDNEIFYGLATDINHNFTQRWLVGFSHEEENFTLEPETLQAIPQNEKAVYPWLEYQYVQNKYGVFKNLNQIQRPEDIPMGQSVALRVGFAGASFDNPDDLLRYTASYSNIIDLSDRHLFDIEVVADGRQYMQGEQSNPSVVTSSVAYHYLQDEKNRWYARVEFGAGESLPQYKQLTVGDITGLRGYPSDYVRGDRRYVFTLERRYFSNIHVFNVMRLGGLVFFDTGKAWGLNTEPKSPLLSNVGIGVRLSSTKVRIGNIVHLNVAMPTSAKTGLSKYQVTVGAYQQF
jgi:Omp85 superfamily domain